MTQNSFDIVSQVDLQEVDNAVQQARKEITQRFDFKGKIATLEFKRDEKKVFLTGQDEFTLQSISEILKGKAVRRKIDLKSLAFEKIDTNVSGVAKQTVVIQHGIPKEKAKQIVQAIKGMGLRVQPQIQEDQVRVTGKNRDDLQTVIQTVRNQDFNISLQFVNYR